MFQNPKKSRSVMTTGTKISLQSFFVMIENSFSLTQKTLTQNKGEGQEPGWGGASAQTLL